MSSVNIKISFIKSTLNYKNNNKKNNEVSTKNNNVSTTKNNKVSTTKNKVTIFYPS